MGAAPIRRSVVAAAVALTLGACAQSTVPPSPTPGVSPRPASPAPSPAPTPPATATPSPTPSPTPTPLPLQGLRLERVATGVSHPVDVRARPDDGTLWVIEQRGVIRRIEGGALARQPVLDIRDAVNDFSIEQGLLGFAFHPDYPADPRVFVFHSKANNDNVLASFEASGDGNVLDPATRKDILTIDKARTMVRHNGGTVLFGPDGLLYLSVGDAAQARLNGQDPATLPASILRIDVDGDPYSIPADNPWGPRGDPPADIEGAPEVWWYGFRNPWRFSIDTPTGMAYVGDVGQERVEEIDVASITVGGLNFGWPSFEGTRRYSDLAPTSDLEEPVLEVRHSGADEGCSIIGGEVYRGQAIPELDGTYFYADWCRGWIRSFRFDGREAIDKRDWSADLPTETVSSFGHDADGELLVLDWQAGTVYRVVPVRQAP